MNKKAWFKAFKKHLAPLQSDEKYNAVMYYEEMYCDRLETGMSETDILREFGEPNECANRILAVSGISVKAKSKPSVIGLIGGVLFLVIIGIPIAAIVLSVVIAFAAVAITGAALVIGGALYAIIAPIASSAILSGSGIVVQIGSGIACCGAGVLLFIGFGLLTKYAVMLTVKGIKIIIGKRGAV